MPAWKKQNKATDLNKCLYILAPVSKKMKTHIHRTRYEAVKIQISDQMYVL